MNDKKQEGETIYRKANQALKYLDMKEDMLIVDDAGDIGFIHDCSDPHNISVHYGSNGRGMHCVKEGCEDFGKSALYLLEPATHHRGSGGYGELPNDHEICLEFAPNTEYDESENWLQEGRRQGALWMKDKILSLSNSGEQEGKFSLEGVGKFMNDNYSTFYCSDQGRFALRIIEQYLQSLTPKEKDRYRCGSCLNEYSSDYMGGDCERVGCAGTVENYKNK